MEENLQYQRMNNTKIFGNSGGNYDNFLSTTSENAVQNKVITKALNDKVEKEAGKGLSENDFTNVYRDKLTDTYTKEEVNNLIPSTEDFATKQELNAKQDTLTAGDNITIENNIISASGGSSDNEFIAIAGTTTAKQIIDAVDAGKFVRIKMVSGSGVEGKKGTFTMIGYHVLSRIEQSNGIEVFIDLIRDNDQYSSLRFKSYQVRDSQSSSKPSWQYMVYNLQRRLDSGVNIKTINNQSILGSGNLDVSGGSGANLAVDTDSATISQGNANIQFTQDDTNGVIINGYGTDSYGDEFNWTQNIPNSTYIGGELAKKQDKLTASTGIKIDDTNNYISAIGVEMEIGVEKPYGTYTEDGVTYQVYSKIIKIDALPAQAGVEGYPHGITGIKQILQVYGFTNDGFVLNASRQNIQDNITIYQVQKAGNIQIEVGKDRSSKSAYVCLVYAKNN